MENMAETSDLKVTDCKPEWVKPEVTEFDVKSTTQAGSGGTWDMDGYS